MRLIIASIALMTIAKCLGADMKNTPSSDADGIAWGYEYVNLGLPSGTLWATCNIGSTSPYDAGDFFAWGETEPRTNFSWRNYKHYKGVDSDPRTGEMFCVLEDIGIDISGTEYDAARNIWGGGWRLPNERDRYELIVFCWSEWVTENGVKGVRVHGRNEHSIFIPAGGYGSWEWSGVLLEGIQGGCWTGVSVEKDYLWFQVIEPSMRAMTLFVDSAGLGSGPDNKAVGYNIRPVIGRKEYLLGVDTIDAQPIAVRYEEGMIHVDGISGRYIIRVSDLSGRTVFSSMVDTGICELPSFSNGIYIISIQDDESILYTSKITIK